MEQFKSTCGLHSQDKTFYCEDCNILICLMCRRSGKHDYHKVDQIDETYHENQQTLKDLLEQLNDAKKIAQDNVKVGLFLLKYFFYSDFWLEICTINIFFILNILKILT